FRRAGVYAERMRKGGIRHVLDWREVLFQKRDILQTLDRERADLLVLGDVREQIQAAQRIREPIRVHEGCLGAVARLRVVGDSGLTVIEGCVDRAGGNLLLAWVVHAPPQRIWFARDDARQLIEELPHVRRQHARELVERALDIFAERRAAERFDER